MKTTILIIVSVLISLNVNGQNTIEWTSENYYTEDRNNTLSIDVENKITLHYKDTSDILTLHKVDVVRVIDGKEYGYSAYIIEPIAFYKHFTNNGDDVLIGQTDEDEGITITRKNGKHTIKIHQIHGVDIKYVQS